MQNNNNLTNNQPQKLEIVQWSDTVDGAELLEDLKTCFQSFIIMKEDEAYAIAMWVIHTYLIKPPKCSQVFDFSPILNISSPEKQCGKSTLREIIYDLVPRPLNAMNATEAALFRIISSSLPTLLIDESDTFLKKPELTGILNSGYKQDGNVIRQGGKNFEETQEFSTWSPKCIVGIGHLSDTLESRCIKIRLKRKRNFDKVLRRNSVLQDDPDFFVNLKRRILRFTLDNEPTVMASTPTFPMQLDDRSQDNWKGIFKIASTMGEDTLMSIVNAATNLANHKNDALTLNIELLIDIKDIICRKDKDRYRSLELIDELKRDPHKPWVTFGKNGLNAHQLATMLKEFDLKPNQALDGAYNHKGYDKSALLEVITRYT